MRSGEHPKPIYDRDGKVRDENIAHAMADEESTHIRLTHDTKFQPEYRQELAEKAGMREYEKSGIEIAEEEVPKEVRDRLREGMDRAMNEWGASVSAVKHEWFGRKERYNVVVPIQGEAFRDIKSIIYVLNRRTEDPENPGGSIYWRYYAQVGLDGKILLVDRGTEFGRHQFTYRGHKEDLDT